MKIYLTCFLLFVGMACSTTLSAKAVKTYDLSTYGVKPNSGENMSPLLRKALETLKAEIEGKDKVVLKLASGKYNFGEEGAFEKEYYISNHDQDQPKKVVFALENMNNVVVDGQGADLIFHGRILPFSLIESTNCTLRNFSIDFETPHIAQVKIVENDTVAGNITFEPAPWVRYTIENGIFKNKGAGWINTPTAGIAFEEKTKRLVYNTSDIHVGTSNIEEVKPGLLKSVGWKNNKLIPGTVVAMRTYYRPTPGIFMSKSNDTKLENITVHYAEGMGLLAQLCENIDLDKFSVSLRGETDPRYFTTQADATHFSSCKGEIVSKNGLYEGMMDDAINVHGTYLKVIKRNSDYTLTCQYMHEQAWGFEWGEKGDLVQFVSSQTMETVDGKNTVQSIKAVDKPTAHGAKIFEITFAEKVAPEIDESRGFGVENLTWTPEVTFSNNIIRNNRARGTLFSTPKKVLVENNLFDHTSGTAILLCGDCNGWYETGACTDVTIRNNRFVNSLTNMFQFTNAIISIYPEIPDLKGQQKYFHSGIVIKNNIFETFDAPILYAKSVKGLVFKNNVIKKNDEYPAFHWNKEPFLLERVVDADISENKFKMVLLR